MLSPQGFRTRIQVPVAEDEHDFLAAMRDSVGLHYPWVTAPKDHAAWQRYMKRLERDDETGFLVRRLDDKTICGVINLSAITYDALCSAWVSYFGVAGQAGKGYMTEGMLQVIRHAFDKLGLHRLEANIQPDNLASIALVQGVGFQYEGLARNLLKINGEWRDHERWAILSEDN
ncbi:MAG: GNAT family N-acetyltransferase [Xanthomonadales bacterium]|nr:GNAT family N-acetyltransferase [Xanthomonadales bacterium]